MTDSLKKQTVEESHLKDNAISFLFLLRRSRKSLGAKDEIARTKKFLRFDAPLSAANVLGIKPNVKQYLALCPVRSGCTTVTSCQPQFVALHLSNLCPLSA